MRRRSSLVPIFGIISGGPIGIAIGVYPVGFDLFPVGFDLFGTKPAEPVEIHPRNGRS